MNRQEIEKEVRRIHENPSSLKWFYSALTEFIITKQIELLEQVKHNNPFPYNIRLDTAISVSDIDKLINNLKKELE